MSGKRGKRGTHRQAGLRAPSSSSSSLSSPSRPDRCDKPMLNHAGAEAFSVFCFFSGCAAASFLPKQDHPSGNGKLLAPLTKAQPIVTLPHHTARHGPTVKVLSLGRH